MTVSRRRLVGLAIVVFVTPVLSACSGSPRPPSPSVQVTARPSLPSLEVTPMVESTPSAYRQLNDAIAALRYLGFAVSGNPKASTITYRGVGPDGKVSVVVTGHGAFTEQLVMKQSTGPLAAQTFSEVARVFGGTAAAAWVNGLLRSATRLPHQPHEEGATFEPSNVQMDFSSYLHGTEVSLEVSPL